MGGRHDGPEAMQRDLWWTIGRHYKVEAQPEDFRVLDDGRLFVAGHYRGEGRASGRRLDAAFIHLIAFAADGRIASLRPAHRQRGLGARPRRRRAAAAPSTTRSPMRSPPCA